MLFRSVFHVNWFRKSKDGKWLWPGFGEYSRVLAWAVERVAGKVDAAETPLGFVPMPGDLNLDGLDIGAAELAELFDVDARRWLTECDLTAEYFTKFGDHVPAELKEELAALRRRLSA